MHEAHSARAGIAQHIRPTRGQGRAASSQACSDMPTVLASAWSLGGPNRCSHVCSIASMCLQAYRNYYPFGAGYDWESGTWPTASLWEGFPETQAWPYGMCMPASWT